MRVPLTLAALLLGACAGESAPLVASDILVTEPLPGANMSAGYLALTNTTAGSITIDRVTSPQFGTVELHESIVENDIARMRRVPALTIGAGETRTLQRGGLHLMLMQPAADTETVTLVFYTGDTPLLSVNTVIGE